MVGKRRCCCTVRIRKYAPDGTLLWSRNHVLTGYSSTHPCSVCTIDANATGSPSSNGADTLLTGYGLRVSDGTTNAPIRKWNQSGTNIWEATDTSPLAEPKGVWNRGSMIATRGRVFSLTVESKTSGRLTSFDGATGEQLAITSAISLIVSTSGFDPNSEDLTYGRFRLRDDGTGVTIITEFGQRHYDDDLNFLSESSLTPATWVPVDVASTGWPGGSVAITRMKLEASPQQVRGFPRRNVAADLDDIQDNKAERTDGYAIGRVTYNMNFYDSGTLKYTLDSITWPGIVIDDNGSVVTIVDSRLPTAGQTRVIELYHAVPVDSGTCLFYGAIGDVTEAYQATFGSQTKVFAENVKIGVGHWSGDAVDWFATITTWSKMAILNGAGGWGTPPSPPPTGASGTIADIMPDTDIDFHDLMADGDAAYISGVYRSGTRKTLKCDSSGIVWEASGVHPNGTLLTGYDANDIIWASAPYICRVERSSGNNVWSSTFGNPVAQIHDICIDADGNIYAVGYYSA